MIEIKNLNKTYDNKNKALKNINIHIEQGEFVFIMGRSLYVRASQTEASPSWLPPCPTSSSPL